MSRLQQAARDAVNAMYSVLGATDEFVKMHGDYRSTLQDRTLLLNTALAASEQGPSVEELVEALRFYADIYHWSRIAGGPAPAFMDKGCRARAILARHDAAKGGE